MHQPLVVQGFEGSAKTAPLFLWLFSESPSSVIISSTSTIWSEALHPHLELDFEFAQVWVGDLLR